MKIALESPNILDPSAVWRFSIGVIDASNNAILAEVPDINLGDIDRLAIWRKIPVFFTASVASVKIRIFHEASQAEGHVDDVSICEVA